MKRALVISICSAILVSVIICLFFLNYGSGLSGEPTAKNTVYQRIIQSGKIRVGYTNVTVGCDVDPKTKEVSGVFPDVLREMAKNMGLKVEFVEEVGFGTMIAGLQTGRYDMMGSPVWPNSTRARQTSFSNPVYYSAIGVWVREGETRFSPVGSWASINDPKVKIGAIDGSTGEFIAQTQFPNASLLTFTELSSEGQPFLDLHTGKIDVFFEEPSKGLLYIKNNPGQIKNIAADQPIRIFANIFMLPAGEYRLQEMINTALEEVQNSGFVDRTLLRHEPAPNSFYRVAQPYRYAQ